jgi:hypothetical protein
LHDIGKGGAEIKGYEGNNCNYFSEEGYILNSGKTRSMK